MGRRPHRRPRQRQGRRACWAGLYFTYRPDEGHQGRSSYLGRGQVRSLLPKILGRLCPGPIPDPRYQGQGTYAPRATTAQGSPRALASGPLRARRLCGLPRAVRPRGRSSNMLMRGPEGPGALPYLPARAVPDPDPAPATRAGQPDLRDH